MAVTQTFLERWLSSWSGNRPEELLTFYHDQVYYSDPAFKQGLSGKEQLKKYLVKLLAKNPDWKWELIHFDQVSPTRYYVKWKATIPSPGKVVIETGLDLLEVENDKIIRNEVYFDISGLLIP